MQEEIIREKQDENAVNTVEESNAEHNAEATAEQPAAKPTKKQQFWQFLKFTAFSLSAGIIQFLLQSTLFDWTHALTYWQAYPIALTASVIWNFTFNRKFTFKAANNVPIAMVLVVIYNVLIVVPFAILGEYLVGVWGDAFGMLVTVILLLINFITEFFWDKFIVFNAKITDKILKIFKKKDK